MAQRQLQVTALKPAARAMDTYVRPEFESNAAAIGKLMQSIDKTDNDRAIKNAEINAVTEALGQGPEDLHSRVGFASTRPDAVAYRFEHRGMRYATDSLPQLESEFQEFLLGANDLGTDIEPFLNEKFGEVLSKMQGGGGSQFLIAGAGNILKAAKIDFQKRHMEFIDKRAIGETMDNLSMRVDGIVHQKAVNSREDGLGGTLPPQAFKERIKSMDFLAVEMSQTTHLTKGQANKAVFDSLLSMAKGNDPANAERYLHMAKLVRYAKGKNGELRPEAFEAIMIAEDAAARKINSRDIAEAAASKARVLKEKIEAHASFVETISNSDVPVTELPADIINYLTQAGISPEKQTATMDAVNKMRAGGQESSTQEKNFINYSTLLMANRQNPNMGASYAELVQMVSNQAIHPSRLKEAQAMLKAIEQASPLISNTLNTKPRDLWVAGIVKMEDDYDMVGLAKKEQLVNEWNSEMNNLIAQHYDTESNMAPTTSQLQSMAEHVKGVMSNNYADEISKRDEDEQGYRDYRVGIDDAVKASKAASEGDGKINLLGINSIGTSGLSSLSGNLSAEAISEHIKPELRMRVLFNPAREFTIEDAKSLQEESLVGLAEWQIFEKIYGEGSFAVYYQANKPKITMAHYRDSIRSN